MHSIVVIDLAWWWLISGSASAARGEQSETEVGLSPRHDQLSLDLRKAPERLAGALRGNAHGCHPTDCG